MILKFIKKIFPANVKRRLKEHLGVPSLHWSLQNLKKKNFNPAVVFDIGAYEGFWSQEVLEVFPAAKIMMVEAQTAKATFLEAVKVKHPNVDYAICLLSAEDGTEKLFAEDETASHVAATAAEGIAYKKIITRSLDALIEDKQFPLPDFLKLDVQGHELEVLKGAGKALANAEVCLLEITLLNIGEETPLLYDMIAFMDAKGFQAYDISQFIRRPLDKALYQADIFFVKKDSLIIADKGW